MPRKRFETAHCPECGEVADVYVAPLSLGEVRERCRNPRCFLSIEHPCRPDPSAPPAHDPPLWRTPEFMRDYRRAQRAEQFGSPLRQSQLEREIPIAGISVSFTEI